MLQEGVSRGSEKGCRQYRSAASGGGQRGQRVWELCCSPVTSIPNTRELPQNGHDSLIWTARVIRSQPPFTIDVRLRTHELGKKKSNLDGVFKKNIREETTILPLHGCWELVVCCFMNAQMVSRCGESNASQGGSSPKQTTYAWKKSHQFFQCLHLCTIKGDFICSYILSFKSGSPQASQQHYS